MHTSKRANHRFRISMTSACHLASCFGASFRDRRRRGLRGCLGSGRQNRLRHGRRDRRLLGRQSLHRRRHLLYGQSHLSARRSVVAQRPTGSRQLWRRTWWTALRCSRSRLDRASTSAPGQPAPQSRHAPVRRWWRGRSHQPVRLVVVAALPRAARTRWRSAVGWPRRWAPCRTPQRNLARSAAAPVWGPRRQAARSHRVLALL
jgi:hypothetical protein